MTSEENTQVYVTLQDPRTFLAHSLFGMNRSVVNAGRLHQQQGIKSHVTREVLLSNQVQASEYFF